MANIGSFPIRTVDAAGVISEISAASAEAAASAANAAASSASASTAAALAGEAKARAEAAAGRAEDALAGMPFPENVQPRDATLTSIAALGTSAGKMLYTTGVDTWAEAEITAAGLALLDDATTADQRATLGLGTVTTFAEEVTDLDAITRSGWNRFADERGAGMVLTIFYDGSSAVQLFWDHNKGESDTGQWIRWRAASAWGDWVRLYGSQSEIKTDILNASGNAPTYACRAWVNFNGTGTPAIRAAGNVSSITDNGVGDYTVNFATAMPDANYAAVGGIGSFETNADNVRAVPGGRTSGSYRFKVGASQNQADSSETMLAFFR